MKLIIQRVERAQVTRVESSEVVGKIDKGLFVLVGIKKGDTTKNADELANKLVKIRLMADSEEKMNLSVKDANGEFLVVSQFTLYANTKDGNRPSFLDAALPDDARKIYDYFIEKIKSQGLKVEKGSFGDYMKIDAILDGPVTIVLEN